MFDNFLHSLITAFNNFMLLIAAVVLATIFFPIGIVFTLGRSIRTLDPGKPGGYLTKSILALATAIDVIGNTVCRDFFNATLRKPTGYAFGDYRETISSVLGKNKRDGTLTDTGRGLANLLNWIQPNHVENSIV